MELIADLAIFRHWLESFRLLLDSREFAEFELNSRLKNICITHIKNVICRTLLTSTWFFYLRSLFNIFLIYSESANIISFLYITQNLQGGGETKKSPFPDFQQYHFEQHPPAQTRPSALCAPAVAAFEWGWAVSDYSLIRAGQ